LQAAGAEPVRSSSHRAAVTGNEFLAESVAAVTAKRHRPGFFLRVAGAICLLAALVVGGYLAWQLWGTGITTSRAQTQLKAQFAERLGHSQQRPSPPAVSFSLGDPVAILRIPRIDLDMVVVEGSDSPTLKKGPGHYPGTAFPWEERGAVAIAGHRTTYGQPFWSLNELRDGDLIRLVTEFGTFDYQVARMIEVAPTDSRVLEQTTEPTLVLTTCTPRFSASRRLIVFAER
jgi:sortase A